LRYVINSMVFQRVTGTRETRIRIAEHIIS
jgi:hypothetical protein